MSPTLLEVTVGLIAAVLVFLFALRVVPLVIDELSRYFDKTLDIAPSDEKEPQDYER
ncbi:MAG: hypothetical protein M3R24_19015 [Chloroflexota bacterium]|nr:hypothetical protein [Chloroflexota bacterium]